MSDSSFNQTPEVVDSAIAEFGGLQLHWVLTPEGRKAVKASDVVVALGKEARHTSRICNQYVFADYKFKSSFGDSGRPAIYLYEQGAVQLATRIESAEAEPFQRWIFEIVVKLFAEGGYIMPIATQQQLSALKATIEEFEKQIADRDALIEQRTKQLGQAERMVMCGKDIHDRTQLLLDMVDYRDSWDDMYDRGECTERQKFTIQNYVHELRWGLAEEGFSTAVVQRSFEMVKEFAGRLVQKDPIRKRDLDSVFREQFKSVFYSYGLPVKAAKNAKDGKGSGKTSSKKTLAK